MNVLWITAGVAGCMGLLLGSFLNVCIVRLPVGESVVRPRSHCMSCGEAVSWFDNIPVVSYLLLRGKCRDCHSPFAWSYPAVELATCLWFAFAFATAGKVFTQAADVDAVLFAVLHSTAVAVFGFLLIGLIVMDWRTGLLPNEFTLGGVCLGLFFAGAESFWVPSVRYKTFFTPEEVFFFGRLGAAAAGFLLLWTIGALYKLVRRRPGMGLGDAKLLAMIGAFLGFGATGVALFAGILLAGLLGIALLAGRRATGSTHLPFGSFLAVGALLAAAVGEQIVRWYSSLFR